MQKLNFSTFSIQILRKKIFCNANFSKNIMKNPKNFSFSVVVNNKNDNYIVVTTITQSKTAWQAFKNP